MRSNWHAFKTRIRRMTTPRQHHGLDPDALITMARGIMNTRVDEIACSECFQQVDRFVEQVLDDKDATAAMLLVQDHLDRCHNCREEYEALLAAVRAVS